ncbi:TPA: hypothetical protein JLH81_004795 [Escherichia coli]|nr:hypothetical protein [Escherichia coli]
MAWTQVRANKGAPGIDRISIEQVEKEIGVGNFLRDIQKKLVAKRYIPQPVRKVYIPKSDGKVGVIAEADPK